MHAFRLPAAGLALLVALLAPLPSQAARSDDNCTGFIDSLPATITTQGTWCLRANLSTSITVGAAITIANSNITIDCNDFKIGGLLAGPATLAQGIQANDRLNATVRNCNVRGFYIGISIEGLGGGHVIEDNRLEQNLYGGIYLSGDESLVQRNRIVDTGGRFDSSYSFGILASADIIGNTVAGGHAALAPAHIIGIEVAADGHEVRDNLVRGLIPGSGGRVMAINANAVGASFTGNRISVEAGTAGSGIDANGGFCIGNVVRGYTYPYQQCRQSRDNLSLPLEP